MMAGDPFASHPVSLVLAWVGAVPLIAAGISGLFGAVREKVEGYPRWFIVWFIICLVVLSPLRYVFLQVLFATAYPVQSWRALFSTLLLGLYVPVVFMLLCAIGLVLPVVATLWVAFGNVEAPKITRVRLIVGALLAPVTMTVGYFLFLWALTFGARTTHWLNASDVIGATNGPALAVYSVGLKRFMPLPVPMYLTPVTRTDRDMLRNHVAGFYLGWEETSRYVRLAYPAVYDSLIQNPGQ